MRGKKTRPSARYQKWWIFILIALFVAFMFWFVQKNGDDRAVEEALNDAIEEIVEEQTTDHTLDDTEQIVLEFVGEEGDGSGIARRGVSGDLFTHVVVAELPAIDESTYFYEGWLVKPGVTQFFSTGDMFPRADGKWGLVWEVNVADAPEDLLDYTKVVITLEPRDGDPAPAPTHVLEGTF